ncbi:hypothetical protein ACLOJK_032357 [Asimina triloba]
MHGGDERQFKLDRQWPRDKRLPESESQFKREDDISQCVFSMLQMLRRNNLRE